jgi:hypothetical protein
MDGLPGMKRGLQAAKTYNVAPIKKMVGPLAPTKYQAGYGFSVLQVLSIALIAFLVGLAVAMYGRDVADMLKEGMKGSGLLETGTRSEGLKPSPLEALSGLWATA